MNVKKIAAVCKRAGEIRMLKAEGKTFAGTGAALYELPAELPTINTRNCWICWNKPAPKEYQNMDKKKVEVEDRWAYMEDGSAVCPRCGKRYERRKFEFVGACCEACGANNIVKTEIKEDE